MLALLVVTEGSGVESPYWRGGEVREEHLLSAEIPGEGISRRGELYRRWRENRVVFE
jgi:hypothetical protein